MTGLVAALGSSHGACHRNGCGSAAATGNVVIEAFFRYRVDPAGTAHIVSPGFPAVIMIVMERGGEYAATYSSLILNVSSFHLRDLS